MTEKIDTTTCPTRKRFYRSYGEAEREIRRVKRRKSKGLMPPVRFYRCPVCSGYHLSSTKEGKVG